MADPGRGLHRGFQRWRSVALVLAAAVTVAGCASPLIGDEGAAPAPPLAPAGAIELPAARSPSEAPEAMVVVGEAPSVVLQAEVRRAAMIDGALDSGRTPAQLPFVVDPMEVHAAAKQVAGTIAMELTTYEPATSLDQIAAQVAAGDDTSVLAGTMAPLFHPAMWSRGRVVYPQLGGMRPDRCSVMVVVSQEVGAGDQVEFVETRTLDIRLRKENGSWVFDELASAGGARRERPADLPEAAVAVLDNPRIDLPDSARWDIYQGHTSVQLLELMNELAERTPFGVVVLAAGHPYHVFATDRTSNHSVGKAVDVYLLGDTRVIDDRSDASPTYEIVDWLYAHPDLRMIGSPWALDGVGGRSFTDEVHQDHLHISVRS